MGNWSPYSEEWEKQRVKKIITETNAARIEFEKKPPIYKALYRFAGTMRYYSSLLFIHFRRLFDRKYREEMEREIDEADDKALRYLAELLKEDE